MGNTITLTKEQLENLIEQKVKEMTKTKTINYGTRFSKELESWLFTYYKPGKLMWKHKTTIYGVVKAALNIRAISDLNENNYQEALDIFESLKSYFKGGDKHAAIRN